MESIAILEKFLNISNIKNINVYEDTPINVSELWTFTQNIDSTVNITNFAQFRAVYSEFLINYFTNEWKLYEYLYDNNADALEFDEKMSQMFPNINDTYTLLEKQNLRIKINIPKSMNFTNPIRASFMTDIPIGTKITPYKHDSFEFIEQNPYHPYYMKVRIIECSDETLKVLIDNECVFANINFLELF